MSPHSVTVTHSWDARTGEPRESVEDSSPAAVGRVLERSHQALATVAGSTPRQRQDWLGAVADALMSRRDALTEIADRETALGADRLSGEVARAADQLRFYAAAAVEGSYLQATIDHGPPDLRLTRGPVGPVAVFGASNFPLAFGILGHDTASALAAGCPVVAKEHPAHPRLSVELARVAEDALAAAGAPRGWFGTVRGFENGQRLVTDARVQAVAFTGSQRGGMALREMALSRPTPVPVYAEMGTINAVVVTRQCGQERADAVARGFVESFTLGMGQFCTKPGLLFVPRGLGFPAVVARALAASQPVGHLLTEAIARSYREGVERLAALGAAPLESAPPPGAGWGAGASVLQVSLDQLVEQEAFTEECFGPVALVAEYDSLDELAAALDRLPGALAAAVHLGAAEDEADVRLLVERLAPKVGRIIIDGWPTGVALSWAQHHGGPWPATSDPSHTSVGANALARFTRPKAYQNVPAYALPPSVQDANPWDIPQRVDGTLHLPAPV